MSEDSKISKAQQKAVHKYVKNNYDRIELTVKPKGKKEDIKAHAQQNRETLNSFINRAIDETIDRDNQKQAKSKEVLSDTLISLSHSPITVFTPEIESQIDLKRLLSDFLYQIDISAAYGNKVLASLLDKARKQQETHDAQSKTMSHNDINWD